MNDVRLDLQQVPARTELQLAAELGEDAPGWPIFIRQEPDGERGGARGGRVARQSADRAPRLQQAPVAGRTAAVTRPSRPS